MIFACSTVLVFACSFRASAQLPSVIDIANGDVDATIFGATADDALTLPRLVPAGDVNADGMNDIVLMASAADGPLEGRNGSGEVYVYFGTSGFSGTFDIAGIVGAPPDVTIFGVFSGDALQTEIVSVTGDVNGDGVQDIVLGAPFGDGPSGSGRVNTGKVHVIFGSPTLPSVIDLANGDADVTVYGVEDGEWITFFNTLLVGDVTGDGIDDLVMATGSGDGPGDARSNAGEAYIVFGSTTLPASIDTAAAEEDVIIYGASVGDRLTWDGAMILSDVNGDNVKDVVLGAIGGDGVAASRNNSGEAYVIFGSPALPSVIDLNSGDEDVTIYGATAFDELTDQGVLDTGDINGDGINDILLGSRRADGPGDSRSDCGEAYVVFGSTTLPSVVDLASSPGVMTVYGAEPTDQLTWFNSINSGDVNGDNIADLLVGAYNADGPGNLRPSAGEIYVVYGSSGLPAVVDLASNDQDVLVYGASAGDQLGRLKTLVAGDVDGDGTGDLILAATTADGPGESRAGSGEAYIVFGSAVLPPVIDLGNDEQDVIIYAARNGDQLGFGGSLAVGDIDFDGTGDLILGSTADGPGLVRVNSREIYIISGIVTPPPLPAARLPFVIVPVLLIALLACGYFRTHRHFRP